MPICVFDVAEDGTTTVPEDANLTGGAAYRWWHFDLADPMLIPWAEQHLHPIPGGALIQPKTRPRCDRFEGGLILNLRGINLNTGEDADEMISVRIYADEDVLVTVRRNKVFAIDAIRRGAEAGSAPLSTAEFLEQLITGLTDRVDQHVATIDERTDHYEIALEDKDTPMPRDLPDNRRAVIRLRRYLEPQRAALSKLSTLDLPMIPETISLSLRELANRAAIDVEELDELQGRLISVQEEHDANIAQRQARHGYVLSLAAAIFLPLGFITGLFGVNVGGMPGVDRPDAFAILCLSMLGLSVLMVILLKLVRWL
ncbi:Zinc transport protein ZntB [Sulfitobacter sp. THAF37]|uniref:zinc transporter ZntB n=1 Tax=Sulfitobacter sp. THAF37 TaxID=2587855 RepID=UPI001267DB59|nr:zinc transporter ZntB [Sulfitobacter sp. THAF37]QFT57952.1 Zinc transport protein ZntB [Sulfitobacter sp. THAF37]